MTKKHRSDATGTAARQGARCRRRACWLCGSEGLTRRRENYDYGESGLQNVILVNIEVRRCPSCGAQNAIIPHRNELRRAIADTIILTASKLDAAHIIFLRKSLSWSQGMFAKYMAVTPKTVSHWEDGYEDLDPVADRLLRLHVLNRQAAEKKSCRRQWVSQGWDSEYYFLLHVPNGHEVPS